MSNFADLDAMMSSVIDDHVGTLIRFTPVAKLDSLGNARETDDRVSADIIGIFIEGSGDIGFLDGERTNKDFGSRVSSQAAVISFDRSSFAVGNLPRKSDKLTVIDTARSFEIIDVLNDGESRIACRMV